MRGTSLPLSIIAALLVCLVHASPAQAQATRTWISGVGDDVNPCSRTAPCKTFAGAISKTAVNGEINCLDPGGYGAVTITKSITLDCRGTYGSILNTGTNGINIPYDSFSSPGESRYTVRIRGLSINGADTGLTGIRILGGSVHPGGTVIVEDVVIDGNFGGVGRGISDERIGGGELFVSNTTIRNTAAIGIAIAGPASPVATQRIDAVLQNVRVQNSGFGFGISSGGMVLIDNSTFTGNTNAGIYGNGVTNLCQVNINNSAISNNGTGVQSIAGGPGVTIRLSNNDIAFNGTAITGATQSFSNNRIAGNTAPGTAPTQITPLSTNPSGQQ